ncbi:hypothetical protein A3H22_01705 [Candidatus Peribacteria bacterium RIFCSPLOWO2_12_FULL_55_15]|nr:MAG: hypothetical protein A2789_02325 [Candidatus Peribacteria bacterium RIFCSPHIGHO2_01_FULL_54_22]OGJ62651.1 MAG: hypothetical protein A3D12_03755 [Candidatus Peribacteria bacterium RIFCSPHIGHO2_02_FULL_55_24]OGJ64167.1 MAG: hypothetical protein A3E47_03790 [Candidatus Peribacteria bacterium RIFCSPHIGHO2_12_FULL_54_10]OGJ68375.1 MAG: hypothetical protein A2947_02590 [Candidatus Peribacteria bacterium RIFCSPLOWO2_01_FULL_54_110]OGJ70293.1 MAG: hypothetical protein A3H90_03540 [Candidatus Pe
MERRVLLAIGILAFLSLPERAIATSIDTRDTVAGLSTEVMLRGFPPDSTIPVHVVSDAENRRTLETTTDHEGSANVRIRGEYLERAGEYDVSVPVMDNAIRSQFTVLPETVDPLQSTITAARRTITADGRDMLQVRVHLMDRYGNALAGRPIALISSRSQDHITPVERETNREGIQEFTVRAEEAGDMLLRAMDLLNSATIKSTIAVTAIPTWTGTSRGYQALSAQVSEEFESVVVEFEVKVEPPMLQVEKEAQRVTVRALDRMGRTVRSYLGKIIFTTTDPEATVPVMQRLNYGEYQFEERDQGFRQFTLALRFYSPGEHTLTVETSENPTVKGEAKITVVDSGIGQRKRDIEITSHVDNQFINHTAITLEGKGPPLINIRALGGKEDVAGETAADGTFRIPVKLDQSRREFTIRVQQKPEEGSADSGPIMLILDTAPPEITSIAFSPEKPNPQTGVLVIAIAEPHLKNFHMRLTETPEGDPTTISLEETSTAGTYQSLFTAPNIGNYQPLFSAEDEAGNSTELRSMLTVVPKPLSKVENVRGKANGTAATLEWDPVPDDVDGYRIYVGEDPLQALYSLNTGRPTTRATVSGLLPGKTYYFSLTAVKGDGESIEKSTPAKVDIIGLTLNVTEEDSGLLLEWPNIPDSLPISSFILEYGTTPNNFIEQRTLNGALRSFTLHDLINDITYHLRLTPVNLTGEILNDLAALGTGTPKGTGFRPMPTEPIPLRPNVPQPPKTSDSGFPPIIGWFAIILTLAGTILYIRHRRSTQKTIAFLQAMHTQYRMV